MPNLTVWLIRHGESAANVGICKHLPADIPLTPKGQQQSQEFAVAASIPPDLIILSPFKRAQASAAPLINRWPNVPVEVWPIQELTYLAPATYQQVSIAQRHQMITHYWQYADPKHCDGEGAESFTDFICRVQEFHQRLLATTGFVVAIGHEQFFTAFQLGLQQGFIPSPMWMRQFRAMEIAHPMPNGEIIKLLLKAESPRKNTLGT